MCQGWWTSVILVTQSLRRTLQSASWRRIQRFVTDIDALQRFRAALRPKRTVANDCFRDSEMS